MIDTSSREALEASLTSLATAYVPGAVVTAAVELGVFAHLREPATVSAVAAALGADEDGVGRLLRALTSLGLVDREGADRVEADREGADREGADREGADRFWCAHAELLDEGALGAVFLHHRRHIAPLFGGLPEALRRGVRPHSGWGFVGEQPDAELYRELARHGAEYDLFLRAMDQASAGVGARIAEFVPLQDAPRLIDLGGGGGGVARELLRAAAGLRVEGVDLAPACRHARLRAHEAGLASRHTLLEGDLRLGLELTPAPLVLLSAVLADFPAHERAEVLAGAVRLVAPAGRLLISETLLADDRVGPPSAAMLSLMSFAAFGGDQLSEGDVRALLVEVGFEIEAVHRGAPRDLVVAARSVAGAT